MSTLHSEHSDSEPGKCYLISLPMELLVMIAELVILTHKSIRRRGFFVAVQPRDGLIHLRDPILSDFSNPDTKPEKVLALTRTCRKWYAIAMPIYYSRHTFVGHSAQPILDFLKSIGHDRRQHITSIAFSLWGLHKDRNAMAKLLYQCTKLRKLEMVLRPDSMGKVIKDPLKGGGIKALRGIRGCDKVMITREFPRHRSILWQNGLDEFERVLTDDLCEERGPADELRQDNLAEVKKMKEKKGQK